MGIKKDWEVLLPKEIKDPDDKKPKDWVDSSMMDDPEDTKPDDWVDEKRIIDSAAVKPDDWDEEEDGEWEAPTKDNPDYIEDDHVYKYDEFGFVGFDLWQVKGGTIFDNIIITDDAAEADAFAKKWKDLSEVEAAKKKEADASKKDDDKKKEDEDDDDDADDEKKDEE